MGLWSLVYFEAANVAIITGAASAEAAAVATASAGVTTKAAMFVLTFCNPTALAIGGICLCVVGAAGLGTYLYTS